MEKSVLLGVAVYWIIVSAAAVFMTVSDKLRAEKHRWRIAESSLLAVALFGGALAEYIAMRCIRHKTQHKKFMVGLPLIIAVHLALIGLIVYFCFFRTA